MPQLIFEVSLLVSFVILNQDMLYEQLGSGMVSTWQSYRSLYGWGILMN